MTQPSIATGLIGFGLAGSAFHAPLIAATPGLRLAGIASSQGPAVAAAWPDVPVFAEPAALIAPDDLAVALEVADLCDGALPHWYRDDLGDDPEEAVMAPAAAPGTEPPQG